MHGVTVPDWQGEKMVSRVVAGLLVVGLVLVGWSVMADAALGATGGGEEAPDLNPLSWRSDLAIWTAAVFLVLFVVLWRFAWGPIVQGLQKREQGIADQIAHAEQSNAEARKLLKEYEQKLAASEDDVQRMLEAARGDAEKAGQQIVETARAEAEVEHRQALGEIELAAARALEELAQKSATLAVELAGKIVATKLDPKAHSHLIEQAVAKFSTQPSARGDPSGRISDGPGS